MSNLVLTDCKLYVGQYNFSGVANQIKLDYNAEMLDATTFNGSGTRIFVPGLRTVALSGKGLAETESVGPSLWTDDVMFSRIGATAVPMSVAPVGNIEGERALSFKAVNATYQPLSGEVGSLLEYDLDAQASDNTALIHGFMMATGAKTVTGNGTGFLIHDVEEGKRVYGALHVVAWTGLTSLTVTIESGVTGSFTPPTTRLTFATKTALGYDWKEETAGVGGITDTYWRAKWTIAGTGSCSIYVVFGIQV